MKIKQLPSCLIGHHLRDRHRAVSKNGRIVSRCVGCGVAMLRGDAGWRVTGRNPIWMWIGAGALGIVLVFSGLRLYAAANPQHDLVVFVGDSITEGVAASDPLTTSRPGRYQVHAGNDVIVANEGVNGITLGSLAGRISSIENYYRSGRRNVIVFDAGSNDFALGAKAAPLFKILQDYALRLRDGGWIVGVGTVMPRAGLPPEQERERQAFNRMITQGSLRAQGISVLDFDAEHRAGRIAIADGVHPSDDGYAGMSRLDTAFADKALGRR